MQLFSADATMFSIFFFFFAPKKFKTLSFFIDLLVSRVTFDFCPDLNVPTLISLITVEVGTNV